MKNKLAAVLSWTGMLVVLIGIAIPFITGPREDLYKYVFAAGAALNLCGRLLTRYEGGNLRMKRLLRIETWASLFFCVAAYFMFADPDPRNWIVFVLAGGVLYAYTSFMVQRI